MWIGVAILANIFLVAIFVTFRKIRSKRTRTRANNINNETRKQIVLNSSRPNDHEYKRSSKLSNLEVVQVGYSVNRCNVFLLVSIFKFLNCC